ncbi:MAG: hypothetical protein ACRESZ_15770 [Methylococcales bacterium]
MHTINGDIHKGYRVLSSGVNVVKLSRSGSEPFGYDQESLVEPGKRLNRAPFDKLRTNG